MSYTYLDDETGKTYEFNSSPSDFIDSSNTPTISAGKNKVINENFDQEQWDREHEAWNSYVDEQIANYDDRDGDHVDKYDVPDNGDVPDDLSHEFTDQGVFDPPQVPGGEGAGGNVLAVNTGAITTFAGNMRLLMQPMEGAHAVLDSVDIRAGQFQEAYALRDTIMGNPGLRVGTQEFILKAQEAIIDVANAADALAHAYSTAEEYNNMSSEDLNEYITDVSGDIKDLTGTSSGSSTGGTTSA